MLVWWLPNPYPHPRKLLGFLCRFGVGLSRILIAFDLYMCHKTPGTPLKGQNEIQETLLICESNTRPKNTILGRLCLRIGQNLGYCSARINTFSLIICFHCIALEGLKLSKHSKWDTSSSFVSLPKPYML